MKKIDLTGERFSRLTVIEDAGKTSGNQTLWLCKCDCGSLVRVQLGNLRSGNTTSCGCLGRENSANRLRTHGMTYSPEYSTWEQMRARCNDTSIANYGGRGISVCERWASFDEFYLDMGARPGLDYSIDRIDNDGHYSCGKCEECVRNGWKMNCRWASKVTQAGNTSRNLIFTINGEAKCLAEWCRRFCAVYATVRYRILNRGMSIEQALELDGAKK